MRIEQRHGRSEEALLLPSRSDTAVSAVTKIREMTQERRSGLRRPCSDHAFEGGRLVVEQELHLRLQCRRTSDSEHRGGSGLPARKCAALQREGVYAAASVRLIRAA